MQCHLHNAKTILHVAICTSNEPYRNIITSQQHSFSLPFQIALPLDSKRGSAHVLEIGMVCVSSDFRFILVASKSPEPLKGNNRYCINRYCTQWINYFEYNNIEFRGRPLHFILYNALPSSTVLVCNKSTICFI